MQIMIPFPFQFILIHFIFIYFDYGYSDVNLPLKNPITTWIYETIKVELKQVDKTKPQNVVITDVYI